MVPMRQMLLDIGTEFLNNIGEHIRPDHQSKFFAASDP